MQPCLGTEVFGQMFHDDFKNHLKALATLTKVRVGEGGLHGSGVCRTCMCMYTCSCTCTCTCMCVMCNTHTPSHPSTADEALVLAPDPFCERRDHVQKGGGEGKERVWQIRCT